MSGFSQPAKPTLGRALVVGSAGGRAPLRAILERLGYQPAEADDPYTAMAELCRRPLAYRALVLSLSGVYREELSIIAAVKQRFSHMEIWLAQTDGKAAALAEGTRLGADGILSDEGIHRFTPPRGAEDAPPATPPTPVAPVSRNPAARVPGMEPPPARDEDADEDDGGQCPPYARKEKLFFDTPAGEAILTAEELRALLQDQPPTRPAANE